MHIGYNNLITIVLHLIQRSDRANFNMCILSVFPLELKTHLLCMPVIVPAHENFPCSGQRMYTACGMRGILELKRWNWGLKI